MSTRKLWQDLCLSQGFVRPRRYSRKQTRVSVSSRRMRSHADETRFAERTHQRCSLGYQTLQMSCRRLFKAIPEWKQSCQFSEDS